VDFGTRKIIHVDMDCFYAAVEVRDNPDLRGKPVAVGGHPEGRGVLTTANYEARKYGVRSAMPVKTALNLCPQLILVPIHFSKYRQESAKVKKVFLEFTDIIQPLSLDEAFLDVTHVTDFSGSASMMAHEIRRRIFDRTQLTASAGIAPNKFLAKVASDWKKPNGQFTLPPSEIPEFIKDLPVGKIPGVGPKTREKMNKHMILTCGDLQKYTITELSGMFGSWGTSLYDICRGVDHRPVSRGGPSKSISIERTFQKDIPNWNGIVEILPSLMEELENRLSKKQRNIQNIFVKIKFEDFQTTTVSKSELKEPNAKNYLSLLEEGFYRESKPVRLIGLGVRLKAPKTNPKTPQLDLF
tara:strand:- start:10491 stop:11555 length:1065 start_codon:yes stop_codon:yes gene_type:complete